MVTAQDAPTLLDIALDALDHGFSVVPPAEDGTKRPDGRWHTFQQRLPTEDELRFWYANGRHGIGVVCGAVSGNLEMLEFEGRAVDTDVHDEFSNLAAAAGLTELVDRVFHGYCEWTPTGGLHLLYRVDGPIAGNTKLARRPATIEELAANPDEKIKVLVETRGEGGYVIVAPSHGPVHPQGREWVLTEGGFASVAKITSEERDHLHRLARALDRMPAPPAPTDVHRAALIQPSDIGQRPGDAYNTQPNIAPTTLQLLERHGWTRVFERSHNDHTDIHLRRPGKPLGTSAVLHMDAGTLVVFSTSTRFEAEEAYTPFAVYTVLEHDGDYSKAASALRPASTTADLSALLTGPSTATATIGTGSDVAAAVIDLDDSLEPIDLTGYLDGTTQQPQPSQLHRDDGNHLIYAGAVNGIHGDSGSGKGWVVCHLITQNAAQGRRTMLLDLEDTADSIISRLRMLGLDNHQILTWLIYIRPQVTLGPGAVERLVELIDAYNVQAVIIDSIGEAFALEGVNEDKDVEVGPWYRRVARPLAETGAAVVLVDHSTKAADNPLHPSGSKRKRAAVTGASYLAEALKPFVKGQGGRLRLTCAKDRHGNYRRGQAVGDLVMDSTENKIDLRLYAPTLTVGDTTVPGILAARAAVEAVKNAGRAMSQNELVTLMNIKAGSPTKRGGIDHAAAEGAIRELEQRGPRNARMFVYEHDLETPNE